MVVSYPNHNLNMGELCPLLDRSFEFWTQLFAFWIEILIKNYLNSGHRTTIWILEYSGIQSPKIYFDYMQRQMTYQNFGVSLKGSLWKSSMRHVFFHQALKITRQVKISFKIFLYRSLVFNFSCLGLSKVQLLLLPAHTTAMPMFPEPSGLTSKVYLICMPLIP